MMAKAKAADKFNILVESGRWTEFEGKMRYAMQQPGHRSFIGVFPASVRFPWGQEGGSLYLGIAGNGFIPKVGRDKVRSPKGQLHLLTDESQLNTEYNAEAFRAYQKKVRNRKTTRLISYNLDHGYQRKIIEPSSFSRYDIQVNGAGPLGLEVSRLLVQMGVEKLTLFGKGEVTLKDICVSSFRAYDPKRDCVTAAKEILRDQTSKLDIIVSTKWDNPGHIIVNTDRNLEARRALWGFVKAGVPGPDDKQQDRCGVFIDAQVHGEQGDLFVIDPMEGSSVEIYEHELAESHYSNEIIGYSVGHLASSVAFTVKEYVLHAPARTGDDAKIVRPVVNFNPFTRMSPFEVLLR